MNGLEVRGHVCFSELRRNLLSYVRRFEQKNKEQCELDTKTASNETLLSHMKSSKMVL